MQSESAVGYTHLDRWFLIGRMKRACRAAPSTVPFPNPLRPLRRRAPLGQPTPMAAARIGTLIRPLLLLPPLRHRRITELGTLKHAGSFRFRRRGLACAASGGGGGDGGGGGGSRPPAEGEEKPRRRASLPALSEIRWGELLAPAPDNAVAVVLTGALAWAGASLLLQLVLISASIFAAAVKYSFVAALLLFVLIALL